MLTPYERNGSDCEWLVWPDSKPNNTREILTSHGFSRQEVSEGLVIEVANFRNLETPRDLVVEKISLDNIDSYVKTMVQGWESRKIDAEFAKKRISNLFGKNDFFG